MTELDNALSQISDIRSQLAASTRFEGFEPIISAATGILALILAAVQHVKPIGGNAHLVVVWIGFIGAMVMIAGFTTYTRSRRVHGAMADSLLSSALQRLIPILAFGVVISAVIGKFSIENVWLLPGLWLMLIGLVGFLCTQLLPQGILWAGVWYFLCGAIVLALAAQTHVLSGWMIGLPLFMGQIIVSVTLWRQQDQ